MSDWTHPICMKCWRQKEEGRTPQRYVNDDLEHCCFCGDVTQDGIYVRHDPTDPNLRCRGEHDPEEMFIG